MKEEWRPINGFEGIYAISNKGRVLSLKRVVKGSHGSTKVLKPRILKTVKDGRKIRVYLWDGKTNNCSVQKLMDEAFRQTKEVI